MNIIKVILGIIYLILSIGCVREMTSEREDRFIYTIFSVISLLTSAILIFNF